MDLLNLDQSLDSGNILIPGHVRRRKSAIKKVAISPQITANNDVRICLECYPKESESTSWRFVAVGKYACAEHLNRRCAVMRSLLLHHQTSLLGFSKSGGVISANIFRSMGSPLSV